MFLGEERGAHIRLKSLDDKFLISVLVSELRNESDLLAKVGQMVRYSQASTDERSTFFFQHGHYRVFAGLAKYIGKNVVVNDGLADHNGHDVVRFVKPGQHLVGAVPFTEIFKVSIDLRWEGRHEAID